LGTITQWLDAAQKIDVIGYPVRYGLQLAKGVVTPDDDSTISDNTFYFLFIFLMYPILIHMFTISAPFTLVFLPLYALLYYINPDFFLEEEPPAGGFENWDILYTPRPGVPAIIAQLYSVGKLLLFDSGALEGEEWGLNLGVFLKLIGIIILVIIMNLALESILAPWLVISLITLPIMTIVEIAKGDFNFNEVSLDYDIYSEYENYFVDEPQEYEDINGDNDWLTPNSDSEDAVPT